MALRDKAVAALSRQFRERRSVLLRSVIAEIHATQGKVRIADLGGRAEYWNHVGTSFLSAHNCQITVINLHSGELKHQDDRTIFFLAVGDATNLHDHANNSFDLVHSNSVIEHLGTWGAMLAFADECRRLAPRHYVQTPSFWFPIDPHYPALPGIHWLPRPIRAFLMEKLPLATSGRAPSIVRAYHMVDAARLLSTRQFRAAFPTSRLVKEKVFLLTKSLIAVS